MKIFDRKGAVPGVENRALLLQSYLRSKLHLYDNRKHFRIFEFAKRNSQSNLFDLLFCEANYFSDNIKIHKYKMTDAAAHHK